MYYIKKSDCGLLIKTSYETQTINKGLKQFLNELLIEELTTFEGRRTALKKKYNLKYNIPIYVHDTCCFYTTKTLRDIDNVCINFHDVLTIKEAPNNKTEIVFKDLHILRVNAPYNTILRKHKRTGEVLALIE
ncbi:MAG: competence protein ComK [Bacillota bacterium]